MCARWSRCAGRLGFTKYSPSIPLIDIISAAIDAHTGFILYYTQDSDIPSHKESFVCRNTGIKISIAQFEGIGRKCDRVEIQASDNVGIPANVGFNMVHKWLLSFLWRFLASSMCGIFKYLVSRQAFLRPLPDHLTSSAASSTAIFSLSVAFLTWRAHALIVSYLQIIVLSLAATSQASFGPTS